MGYNQVLWVDDTKSDIEMLDKYFPDEISAKGIETISEYFKAVTYIKEHFGTFDLVVLDVNFADRGFPCEIDHYNDSDLWNYISLELCKEGNEINYDKFKISAGYYLYIYLIQIGFPKERIVLLTGNVHYSQSETNINLSDDDKKIILEYLQTLSKKPTRKRFRIEIKKIMGEKYNFNYEFPSSIIELLDDDDFNELSIEEIKSRIEKIPTNNSQNYDNTRLISDSESIVGKYNELFEKAGFKVPYVFSKDKYDINRFKNHLLKMYEDSNRYYYVRGKTFEICNYFKQIIENNGDKARKMIAFNDATYTNNKLEIIEIQDMLEQIKNSFPIYIPNKVEELYFLNTKIFSINFEAKLNNKCENEILIAYMKTLKIFRNWSMHKKIKQITDKDYLFLLIISMRAYFKSDNTKLYPYEEKIFNSTYSVSDLHIEDLQLDKSFAEIWNKSYKYNKDGHKNTFDVFDMISNIGSERSSLKKCNMRYIYKLIVNLLIPLHIKNQEQLDLQNNLIKFKRVYDERNIKNVFIGKLIGYIKTEFNKPLE